MLAALLAAGQLVTPLDSGQLIDLFFSFSFYRAFAAVTLCIAYGE